MATLPCFLSLGVCKGSGLCYHSSKSRSSGKGFRQQQQGWPSQGFIIRSQPQPPTGVPGQNSASPLVLNGIESAMKPRGERGCVRPVWWKGWAKSSGPSPSPSFVPVGTSPPPTPTPRPSSRPPLCLADPPFSPTGLLSSLTQGVELAAKGLACGHHVVLAVPSP